jgi:hypothetical protein
VRAHIAVPGKQYPVKADTRRDDLVTQVVALAGQMVTVEYTEQESSNINPNTNRPYINRYVEHITPGVAEPQPLGSYVPPPASSAPTGGAVRPQGGFSGPRNDETMIRRVTWLSAASTASQMLSGLVTSNDQETLRRMGGALFALADSIYARARQVERGSLDGQQAPLPGVGADQPPTADDHDRPPPPTDDDIPF